MPTIYQLKNPKSAIKINGKIYTLVGGSDKKHIAKGKADKKRNQGFYVRVQQNGNPRKKIYGVIPYLIYARKK